MPPESMVRGRIEVTLDQMLQERSMTMAELARRIDLTPANVSVLKTGRAKAIRFTTLAAICAELECQPGDLLRFVEVPEDTQSSFVVLVEPGPSKIKVIKELRTRGLSLDEAKSLLDDVPTVVAKDLPRHEAESLMVRLRAVGADASVSDRS